MQNLFLGRVVHGLGRQKRPSTQWFAAKSSLRVYVETGRIQLELQTFSEIIE